MNRTIKVLIGAVALVLLSAGTASAQTGSLQGQNLFLFSPGSSTPIQIVVPSGLTAPYTITLPGDDGGVEDILVNADGAGTLTWTNGNDIFWRLDGNTGTTPWDGTTGNFLGDTAATEISLLTRQQMSFWFLNNPAPVLTLDSNGTMNLNTEDGFEGLVLTGSGPTGPDAGILIDCAFPPTVGIEVNALATGILIPTCATPPLVGIAIEAQTTGLEITNTPTAINAQGILELNSLGGSTAATNIGNAAGGDITMVTSGDVSITVPGAGSDIVLNGVDTDASAVDVLLLDGSDNVVTRTIAAGDIITGSGTLNRQTRWTGTTTIGDAQIIDDGAAPMRALNTFNPDTDASFDLGTAANRWRAGRFSNAVVVGPAGTDFTMFTNPNTGLLNIGGGLSEIEIFNGAGSEYIRLNPAQGNPDDQYDFRPTGLSISTAAGANLVIDESSITRGDDLTIQATGASDLSVIASNDLTLDAANDVVIQSSVNTSITPSNGDVQIDLTNAATNDLTITGLQNNTNTTNFLVMNGNDVEISTVNVATTPGGGLTPNTALRTNGTGQIESVALTNGQLLIGSTGAAPVAGNIIGDAGITVTNTAGGIELDVDNPVPAGVANQTLYNDGTGWVASSALQNNGTDVTTTGNLSVNGNTTLGDLNTDLVTITAATVDISNVGTGTATTNFVTRNGGGDLEVSTITVPTLAGPLGSDEVVFTDNTGALTSAPLADGQILIGSTGGAPTAGTITGGDGISVVNAAGSITLNVDNPAPTGTVVNSTLRWDGTDWVENTGVRTTTAAGLLVDGSSQIGNDDADVHGIRGATVINGTGNATTSIGNISSTGVQSISSGTGTIALNSQAGLVTVAAATGFSINTAAGTTGSINTLFANTTTIGQGGGGITNLNSPVINAPNLPSTGLSTDEFVVTDGTVLRTASVSTMIGGTPWVVGGNTLAAGNHYLGTNGGGANLDIGAGAPAMTILASDLSTTVYFDFSADENVNLGDEDADLIAIRGATSINTAGAATTTIGSATAGDIGLTAGAGNDINVTLSAASELNIGGLTADATATTLLVQDGSGNVKTRTVGAGTNILTGSGTVNTLSKFTAAGVLGDASITDDGSTVEFSTAAVEMPNLPDNPSNSTWIVTYNNTTGALEKKDLGAPIVKTKSGTQIIAGDGIGTGFNIPDTFVAAGATIICTLQDGTDANDYIVTITAINAGVGFDIRLSGAMALAATKTVHYTITNP